jgi:TOTE conflict system, Archaeo-Eukaryotic Primase domain/CHC2 zinc finger
MYLISDELAAAYGQVFVYVADDFAVQQRNGSYWRQAEPMTLLCLKMHLEGRWTLGTYLLDEYSRCMFAVFDADDRDGLVRLAALASELAHQGIPTMLEASRRGGHLWVHLVEPAPAHVVRAWLLPYAQTYEVEYYPKQDTLAPDGVGSLIRLPLGIHRKSRGWYPFVEVNTSGLLVPVAETVEDCILWACQHVERVAVPVDTVMVADPVMAVVGDVYQERQAHPLPVNWSAVDSSDGVGAIRAWCRSQDILEVIGHYVALDARGVGSCPFKEHHYRGDLRPSFQVFGGTDPHWYCYTLGQGGDLFSFLCYYYDLTPQEGWQRLRNGTLL